MRESFALPKAAQTGQFDADGLAPIELRGEGVVREGGPTVRPSGRASAMIRRLMGALSMFQCVGLTTTGFLKTGPERGFAPVGVC